MKSTLPKFIIPLLACSLIIGSCSKEGLDGEATLVVMPKHHGSSCYSLVTYPDSVYIKFGVRDVPAAPTHDYDVVFVGETGEDHIHCEGLKRGDYSVFCACWDSTMNMRVYGGVVVKIKRSEQSDEANLVVPVAEN